MTDTEARTPPTKSSDEAKPHQHRMAQEQGDAYVTALHHMANTVADAGGEQAVEDVIVAYAVEAAEGMYKMRGGDLVWTEPRGSNAHVEISVRDGADNRFVPGLEVAVIVRASDSGEVAFDGMLPMLWHPWLYHYGANVAVPGPGKYDIEVRVEPPEFHRHDEKNGKRYEKPIECVFEAVEFKA